MKKHFILAAMAMTALFTACSNDDEATPLNEGQVPVSFTISGIDSRATTSANNFTTLFDNGDKIGITGTNVDPDMNNKLFNVTVTDGSATIAADGNTEFTYGEADALFNAYYPYDENFANTFAVQTNQVDGINKSDFLTATAQGNATTPNVTLEFSHRLVLVQVKLTGVTNVNSVILKNAKTKVTYTASTSSTAESTVALATENNEATDIVMYPQTANTTYWAIIPAQEIAAGNLIEVNATEGTFVYTTQEASTFTEKNLVKYSLTVNETVEEAKLVDYEPVTIKAWTGTDDDEISGELEKEIFNLKAEIPTDANSYTNVNGNRAQLTGDTPAWGYNFQDSSVGTVTYDSNNGAIQSTLTTKPNSYNWAKTALFYYSGKNKIKSGKKYRLSFDAWVADDTSITDNKILVTVSSSSGFYALNTGTTGAQTITLNATKTNKHTYIFADKFYTSNSIGSTMSNFDETAPTENSIYIGIAPQTLNTYYITNLMIEEVIEEN